MVWRYNAESTYHKLTDVLSVCECNNMNNLIGLKMWHNSCTLALMGIIANLELFSYIFKSYKTYTSIIIKRLKRTKINCLKLHSIF